MAAPNDLSQEELTDGLQDKNRDKELSDIELMALVGKGDSGALREIIRRHQTPLLNFFRRLGANIDMAEDYTQETFIKLFNYRRKYRPTSKFTTFLYTLARHSWADGLRRQRRFGNLLFRSGAAIKPETTGKSPAIDDQLDIQMALNKLSDKLRMTVVLSIYQGLNYEEVAQVLKIPVGTVKSRMFMAFGQLKEVLHYDK